MVNQHLAVYQGPPGPMSLQFSPCSQAYDLTKFAKVHPGGAKLITDAAGMDATAIFDPIHPKVPWWRGGRVVPNEARLISMVSGIFLVATRVTQESLTSRPSRNLRLMSRAAPLRFHFDVL